MKKIVVCILVLALLTSLTPFAFATNVNDIVGVWTSDNEQYYVTLTINDSYLYYTKSDKTYGYIERQTFQVISDPYVENHFCALFTYSDGSLGCSFINLQEDGTLIIDKYKDYTFTKLK